MMTITLGIELVLFVLLVAATAVMSAADGAVALMTRSRTRRLLEADRSGAEAVDSLTERPSRLAGALAVLRVLTYAIAALTVVEFFSSSAETVVFLVRFAGAVVGVAIAFVLGETLPRALAVHNPERVALASGGAALKFTAALYPVARAFSAGWLWLVGLVAEERVVDVWITEDEYRNASVTDDEESAREEAEEAFIDAVADFTSKIVREVMVPRPDMECLEDTCTVAEAIEAIERSGYSRLPVYHESVDDILGVLYAKDLLVCMGRGECDPAITALAREAYFVPETKPIEELLVEMRSRTHIAVVADEYGGTAGLVTIEDLLEEIVGEIFDEYDRAEPFMVSLGTDSYRVDGRMPIDDLNEAFGTDIDIEADSVGGLFIELAGHIPDAGEQIVVEGLRLTVDDVENNRIRRMIVEPAVNVTDEENQDA
ncbi:MAG: HlyC/CorC family transporter [Coriobacteriia bacterium]|nr:HlyC/CorC family transporter [Coriobacteriia bacterium]